jgi:hypothetical protein
MHAAHHVLLTSAAQLFKTYLVSCFVALLLRCVTRARFAHQGAEGAAAGAARPAARPDAVSKVLRRMPGTLSVVAEYRRNLRSGFIKEILEPELLSPMFR